MWIGEKLFQRDLLLRELAAIDPALGDKAKLGFCEHHYSHAASAYYPAPFHSALVLTMDGVGEWATTSAAIGQGDDLQYHQGNSLSRIRSGCSIRLSPITPGFKVNSGEYKVMGLAPYGEPKYAKTIFEHLIDVKPDGSFKLNLDYFSFCTGLTMTDRRFDALFGGPPRRPDQRLEQRHMDLAASIQAVTEEVVLRLTRSLAAETGHEKSLPCRRGRAQLRRQWQGSARRTLRRDLHPAGGGRCRRRARGGARRLL